MSSASVDIYVVGKFNEKTGRIEHASNTAKFPLGDITGKDAEAFALNAEEIVAKHNPDLSLSVLVETPGPDIKKFEFVPRPLAA